MSIQDRLQTATALVRLRTSGGIPRLALWKDGSLHDLGASRAAPLRSLDALMQLRVAEIRRLIEDPEVVSTSRLDSGELLAPVESQEVWAAGVTYMRSRNARMDEAIARDVYEQVYTAERPELFFKCAGWRVVPDGGEVGVRADSQWDVPEPELAVLTNAHGEVVAYACGNDMTSRSIEGQNPLYLPQAKIFDAACSIGPAAVLAWNVEPRELTIRMRITRDGEEIFSGSSAVADMVRDVAELAAVTHAAYSLPHGAWLLTGTAIVPEPPYTSTVGDAIEISIDGVGTLMNRVVQVPHTGAAALPRV